LALGSRVNNLFRKVSSFIRSDKEINFSKRAKNLTKFVSSSLYHLTRNEVVEKQKNKARPSHPVTYHYS